MSKETGIWGLVRSFIDTEIEMSVKREKWMRKHPDKVETTIRYGIFSFICSFFALCFYLFVNFGFYILKITFTVNLAIIGNIFTLAIGIGVVFGAIYFGRYAMGFGRQQKCVNNKIIGNVSLVIGIIAFIISIIGTIISIVMWLAGVGINIQF